MSKDEADTRPTLSPAGGDLVDALEAVLHGDLRGQTFDQAAGVFLARHGKTILQSLPPVAAPSERTVEVVARALFVAAGYKVDDWSELADGNSFGVYDETVWTIHGKRYYRERANAAIQAHLSCLPGQVDAEKVLMRLLICQGELETIARTRSTNFAAIDQLVIDNRAVLERLSASGVGHG